MQELVKRVEKLEKRMTDYEKSQSSTKTPAPVEACVMKVSKVEEKEEEEDDVDLFGSDSEASGKS